MIKGLILQVTRNSVNGFYDRYYFWFYNTIDRTIDVYTEIYVVALRTNTIQQMLDLVLGETNQYDISFPTGLDDTDLITATNVTYDKIWSIPNTTELNRYCTSTTLHVITAQALDSSNNAGQINFTADVDRVSTFLLDTSTPNATVCGYFVNDIAITNIKIEAGFTVTVTATATTTPLEYSLNNVTYQSSNVFSSLLVGNYTLYVRDAALNVVSQSFRVKELFYEESYGNYKYVQSKDELGNTIYAYIQKKDYSGSSTEVKGSYSFLNINTLNNNDPKYQALKPTSANLTLIDQIGLQFIELFTAQIDKYKLKVVRDGVNVFEGFLLSDGYTEEYQQPPYTVQFVFYDGLANLKNFDFVDDNGNNFIGIRSLLEIINICVHKTGLNLPFKIALNYFGESHTQTDGYTALEQTYIDCKTFYTDKVKSCHDVIRNILMPFRARIYQENGYWHIKTYNYYGSFPEVTFNTNGEYVSHETKNYQITTTEPDASPLYRLMGGGSLSFDTGVSELTVVQTNELVNRASRFLGFGENKPFAPYEEQVNVYGEKFADLWATNFSYTELLYSQSYFSGYDSQKKQGIIWIEKTYYGSADFSSIETKPISIQDVLGTSYLFFYLKYQLDTKTTTAFKYSLQYDAKYWNDTTKLWVASETFNSLNHTANDRSEKELFFSTDILQSDGNLIFKIFVPQALNSRITLLNLQLDVLNQDVSIDNPEKEVTFTTGNKFVNKLELQTIIGDRVNFNPKSYGGVLYYDAIAVTPILTLNRTGETDTNTLASLFVLDLINEISEPYQKLNIPLQSSENLLFSSIIEDKDNGNKLSYLNARKWDVIRNVYDVELTEILGDNGEDYILYEDGQVIKLESSDNLISE
jgi:hypothetical protein